MDWLECFNAIRKESGMSLDELSERSGIPKGTLSKITSGITKNPSISTMQILVHAMGRTLDDLDPSYGHKKSAPSDDRTQKLATQFFKLDEHGKVTVECVAKVEESRMQEQPQTDGSILATLPILTISDREVIRLPLLLQSRSAGTGGFADDEKTTKIPVYLTDITRQADYLVRVHGESMEPDYPDGCIVAVRRQEDIPIGKVGVFVSSGDSFIKRRGKDCLESINEKCPDVIPSVDTVCRGMVLGIVE